MSAERSTRETVLSIATSLTGVASSTLECERIARRHFETTLNAAKISERDSDAAPYWIAHSLDGHPDCDISRPLKSSTLAGYVEHLNSSFLRSGRASPITDRVRAYLAFAIHNYGIPPKQKRPLFPDDLLRIVHRLDLRVPIELEFRAMLLFGYESCQRFSEWSRIWVPDLAYDVEHGYMAQFTFAKNNQSGEPRSVGIRYARRRELCPVIALREWLEYSEFRDGPAFRQIDRPSYTKDHGQFTWGRFHRLLLMYAGRASLDLSDIASTSLRAGRMTTAADQGQTESTIFGRSLHRTKRGRVYIRGLTMRMDDYDGALAL